MSNDKSKFHVPIFNTPIVQYTNASWRLKNIWQGSALPLSTVLKKSNAGNYRLKPNAKVQDLYGYYKLRKAY